MRLDFWIKSQRSNLADNLNTKQQKCNRAQNVALSPLAQTLLENIRAELPGFDTLSPQDQQQIIGLVNRAAEEQKNIGDQSYDKAISTVVEIADSACLAYEKDNAKLDDALVTFGNTVLDCTVAFSKGLMQGACISIQSNWQAANDPIHTLTNLAKGVVHLAGCLHPIGAALVIGHSTMWAVNNLGQALENVTQQLNDIPLVEIFEKLGEKTGEFGTDLLILDGVFKGASIIGSIAVAETAVMMQKAEQGLVGLGELAKAELAALTESAEIFAKTAEGFEVAVNAKRADIAKEAQAFYSENSTFNKTKNGLKSEAAACLLKKHPNGKYVNNSKHHKNSPNGIGKPPLNGQKALNESLAVSGKKYRIGVEDGKIIQFSQHRPNEFHGYIVENYHKLDGAAQKTLQKAGLVNPKSGKIIK